MDTKQEFKIYDEIREQTVSFHNKYCCGERGIESLTHEEINKQLEPGDAIKFLLAPLFKAIQFYKLKSDKLASQLIDERTSRGVELFPPEIYKLITGDKRFMTKLTDELTRSMYE